MLEKHGISVKDGLYEILDYLSKTKVKIAVATSTSRERATSLLIMASVDHYFDYVLCGDEVENSKPHPEIFLKVADKLGCLPEKSIVLEDSEAGIIAAHSAGMSAIMVPDMKEPEPNIQALAFKQMSSLHEVKLFFQEQIVLN
jgi:HAD superfamily hydrolase (TIGR01509 family)